jgi:hypothetical protein
MSALQSCMGGWCTKRGHCAHYHAAEPGRRPEERLCVPGHDGIGVDQPVRLHRPAGTGERGADALLRGPGPMEMLA